METTRAPPGRAPGYVGRVYKSSLRPVVLVVSGLAALWATLYGISSFRVLGDDESKNVPGLRTMALALGILYMVAACIEVFGFITAMMQRAGMARIYAILSILSSVLIVGGNLTQVVFHFTQKNNLINLCTSETTGDTVCYGWGLFTPSHRATLSGDEARDWCNAEWKKDSLSSILTVLVESILLALFVSIAFAYYQQVVDPTSPVNETRINRPGFAPQNYNPPYEPQFYPPPPGAPPGHYDQGFVPPYDANKPPGYVSDAKYEGDPDYKQRRNSDDRNSTYKEDPFSDFDNGSSYGHGRRDLSPGYEEHDLTSRPRPGERDTF